MIVALPSARAAEPPVSARTAFFYDGWGMGNPRGSVMIGAEGTFSPAPDSTQVHVEMYTADRVYWGLSLARTDRAPIQPGTYTIGSGTFFHLYGGNQTCHEQNGETGSFTIHEIERAADGTPTTLAVSFDFMCNDRTPTPVQSHGELRINSAVPMTSFRISPSMPDLHPDTVDHDFGELATSTSAAHTLATVTNTGTTPIRPGAAVDRVATPFDLSTSTCDGTELAPGDACQINVVFAPTTGIDFGATIQISVPEANLAARFLEVRGRGVDTTPPAPTYPSGAINIVAAPGQSNEAFYYTKNANVTITLPVPTGTASHVRLSNDGQTWVVRPYQTSVAWSLVDAVAGGHDVDGDKLVFAEWGDGTSWSPLGMDAITLDRVPPTWPSTQLEDGAASVAKWRLMPPNPHDEVSGVGDWRMSLDGVRWGRWGEMLDLRSINHGGSWALGTRTIWFQGRDRANNATPVVSDTINLTYPPLNFDQGNLPMRFEFPRKAVTGELFTIRPIYPAGFKFAPGAKCSWNLRWGDEESLYGFPNENSGYIQFQRAATAGGCGEWTFTLPWVPVPTFDLYVVIQSGTQIYETANWKINAFSAAIGGTSRHFTDSNIPFLYLLPSTTLSDYGDSVTYRLYATDDGVVPNSGWFDAYTESCYVNPHLGQQGGSTFTYRPVCPGNWVTTWGGTYRGGEMRAQFDPVVDGAAPTVTAPVARLRTASANTAAPIDIVWSGKDAASGVHTYQLQVSENGGTWRSIGLPNRLSTAVNTWMKTSGTTRYRVRARDVVGNWSGWAYGPTLRGAMYQETYKYIRWGGAWTNQPDAAWSGGAARRTTGAAATAQMTFTGRSIGWVARTGPDQGFVRVSIDGAHSATIDLRGPTVGYVSVRYFRTWATSATRTIRIQNLGTTGTPAASVDGFIVLH